MAKEINTRIQLKHDTLANWNSSSIALKYGEAAVAFVDTATTDAHGNIVHVPTALLKFGDATGTKTFKDLPFASALAADVYNWAKAHTVALNGKNLVFQKADGTEVHSVALNFLTAADAQELLKSYYTKTEIDSKLEAINETITDLDVSALAERVTTVENTLKTHGDIVTHNVAEFATAAQGTTADNTAATIATYGDIVTHNVAEFDAAGAANTVNEAFEAYKTSNNAALAGVKATAEAARTEEEVNSQIDTKIAALNLANTYEPKGAEQNAKNYVDQKFTDANLAQYTTEQEVKDIVDGVIAGAADSDTYNSLTKLVDYIDTHGGEAADMAEAIETLEGDVKGLKEAPSAGIKATDIEAWNGEIGAKALAGTKTTTAEVKTQIEAYGYATEADLTLAENRVTALEGKPAVGITAAQITNWDKEVGAKELAGTKTTTAEVKTQIEAYGYVQKSEATGYGDILTKTDAAKTYLAKVDAESVKVTNATNADNATKATQDAAGNVITATYATKAEVQALTTDDIDGGTETWYFNCGTASEVV